MIGSPAEVKMLTSLRTSPMSAEKLDAEAPMMRREVFLALRVVIRVGGVLLGEKVVVVTGRNWPYFAE